MSVCAQSCPLFPFGKFPFGPFSVVPSLLLFYGKILVRYFASSSNATRRRMLVVIHNLPVKSHKFSKTKLAVIGSLLKTFATEPYPAKRNCFQKCLMQLRMICYVSMLFQMLEWLLFMRRTATFVYCFKSQEMGMACAKSRNELLLSFGCKRVKVTKNRVAYFRPFEAGMRCVLDCSGKPVCY